MQLDSAFIQLPLQFDGQQLGDELQAIPESAWNPHPQGFPGNSALLLIARDGNPRDDALTGPMQPTPNLQALPYLQQVLAAFNTVWGRSRLMRIDGNAEANWHMDANYYWHQRIRVHVPIQTNESVRFHCGEQSVHMAAGEAWIFNTWQMHNVFNPHPDRRIHLVADTLGSAHFHALVRRGRRLPADQHRHWQPDPVLPWQPNRHSALVTEQHNAPRIMSPWEMERLSAMIFADLVDASDPVATQARALVRDCIYDWHQCWARFADSDQGLAHYQALRATLHQQLQALPTLLLGNGMPLADMLIHALVNASINEALRPAAADDKVSADRRPISSAQISAPAPESATDNGTDAATNDAAGAVVADAAGNTPNTQFDRPVFIVAAPRSGSSWLFETLARSEQLLTLGGEGHAHIESIPALQATRHQPPDNALTASDASSETVAALQRNYLASLKDARGEPVSPATRFRFLEKTPKNALRIAFLKAAFADARFIYLHRQPEANMASMMEAWQSGRFVTYPQLTPWQGPPWSLLLPPGWPAVNGKPLAEICAWQWAAANNAILDALAELPAGDWMPVSYEALCEDSDATLATLCDFIGIAPLSNPSADTLSRHTLTPPDSNKWRKHEAAILEQQSHWRDTAQRIAALPGAARQHTARQQSARQPPAQTPPEPAPIARAHAGNDAISNQHPAPAHSTPATTQGEPGMSQDSAAADSTTPSTPDFSSVFTSNFPEALQALGLTLLVTTYQAGKLIVVREQQGKLNTHFKLFNKPMGLAGDINQFAIGTLNRIEEFRNMPAAARNLPGELAHDGVYVPRQQHITGDIDIHEMAFDSKGQLWFINTRFSCLCVRDFDHSFVPKWRPPHISGYAPEDRCHLNGLAMRNGKPRYVTMLGQTDSGGGWRENKRNGGLLMDISDNRIIAESLSMPHSPRWYRDTLWVLESGEGSLATVDLKSGKLTTVCTLPGFTRGLDFYGDFAFIGLSQVRESAIFSGLPLTERDEPRHCGVWVVNINTGETVAFLRFEGSVQEIFAVQALPGLRHPEVLDADDSLINSCYALPDDALKLVDYQAIERSRAQAQQEADKQSAQTAAQSALAETAPPAQPLSEPASTDPSEAAAAPVQR